MSDNLYIYGEESLQDVAEARRNIVAAFDLLIKEMREYMCVYDSIVETFETDEHQALIEQMLQNVHQTINRVLGVKMGFQPINPEAEKHHIRDENTTELGGQGKRLQELQVLRIMFAKTNPESIMQETVHKTYRIFKIQVMRCATDFSEPEWSDTKLLVAKLIVYSKALQSCARLDESWDKDRIFPFANVDF